MILCRKPFFLSKCEGFSLSCHRKIQSLDSLSLVTLLNIFLLLTCGLHVRHCEVTFENQVQCPFLWQCPKRVSSQFSYNDHLLALLPLCAHHTGWQCVRSASFQDKIFFFKEESKDKGTEVAHSVSVSVF